MGAPVKIPQLRIGRNSQMVDYDVSNLAVRDDDRPAFLGVIAAREKMIEVNTAWPEKGNQVQLGMNWSRDAACYALNASSALKEDGDRAEAIKQLELTAAMAIAAITKLRGK